MRAFLEECTALLVHRFRDRVWEVDIAGVFGGSGSLRFKVEYPACIHIHEGKVEPLREDGKLLTDRRVKIWPAVLESGLDRAVFVEDDGRVTDNAAIWHGVFEVVFMTVEAVKAIHDFPPVRLVFGCSGDAQG